MLHKELAKHGSVIPDEVKDIVNEIQVNVYLMHTFIRLVDVHLHTPFYMTCEYMLSNHK